MPAVGAAGRLGEGERGQVILRAERTEKSLLLLGGAAEEDRLEREAVRDDRGRHPAARVGELFDDKTLLERSQATAAELGGNVEIHQTQVERLPVDFLGEAGGPVALGRMRRHLGSSELAGQVPKALLFGGK